MHITISSTICMNINHRLFPLIAGVSKLFNVRATLYISHIYAGQRKKHVISDQTLSTPQFTHPHALSHTTTQNTAKPHSPFIPTIYSYTQLIGCNAQHIPTRTSICASHYRERGKLTRAERHQSAAPALNNSAMPVVR